MEFKEKQESDSPVSSSFSTTTISHPQKNLQVKTCRQIDWNQIDEREATEYLWKEVEALSCLDPPHLSEQVFTNIKPFPTTEGDVLKEEISWLNEEYYKDQQENSLFCFGSHSTLFTPETLIAGVHLKTLTAKNKYPVQHENQTKADSHGHPRGSPQYSPLYDRYQPPDTRLPQLLGHHQYLKRSRTILPTRFIFSNGVLTDAHMLVGNEGKDIDSFHETGGHPQKQQLKCEKPIDPNNNKDDSLNRGTLVVEPRRPKNGFMRYSIACRQIIAAERPKLDNREISRILGSRWRKMSAEERKPYELEFAKDIAAIREQNPDWRYAPAKRFTAELVEPMPSRLRPREKLKRNIPALVRPYRRKRPRIYKTKDDLSTALVQCSSCGKWRKLPSCVKLSDIDSNWKCEMNPDVVYNACWIPDEWIISRTSPSTSPSTKSQSIDVKPTNNSQHNQNNFYNNCKES
ncbi:hypothetical protein LOTGIDRAFT_167034 [Lottia gigantea]|uniref:HMG box domain-containing protein n=1 Tax=Lottia gigantea TaxID=225164 RepID=V4BDF6_LOTGI|nr:hypothetical protein LOTGIDRAFT_167034 [Lottia gigantea]ESO86514.1 hypothetical protein LOTGIDRAFT_167034 [Lottia gigantea]